MIPMTKPLRKLVRALRDPASLILLALTMTANADPWEPLAPLPEPSGGFICGVFDGNILIAGGTNWTGGAKQWLDHIWVFEPLKNAWRGAGRLPSPLAYAVTGQTAAGLWFAGGSSGAETHAALSLLEHSLVPKSVAAIAPHFVYAAGAVLNSRLIVVGGAQDQARTQTATNACFALDLRTGKATPIASLPVPDIITGAAAACGGRLYIFCGAHWDAATGNVANMAGAFVWSPFEDRWTALPPYPFAGRGQTAIALDDRHIYIAGGYRDDPEGFTDEAFLFDTKTETFRRALPLPYRAMVSLVIVGDQLYCLGGEDAKKHRTDAAFRIPTKELIGAPN
jgi:N-acetylneuraminic acid mutarotase